MESKWRLWRASGSKMTASRHKMMSGRRHRGRRSHQDGDLSIVMEPSWCSKWSRNTCLFKMLNFVEFSPQNVKASWASLQA